MSIPTVLSSLNTREAITDALYRAVLGIDTDDVALFDSAFTKDAKFDLGGRVMDGLDAIHTESFNRVSKLDTTHFLTNIRIDVKDGASTANVSASALAQHYPQGQGMQPDAAHFLTGCLYRLECVKDEQDGLWRVKYWKLQIVWTEGDRGVMTEN